jgi:hypothetical protein
VIRKTLSLAKFASKGFKLLLCALAVIALFSTAASAQNRPSDQDSDQGGPSVSAGGNWMQYSSEDRMTAQKRTRFVLPANEAQDSDNRAQIILYCTDGKLKLADFRPNMRLARPNWPGFWGQPQMRVRVRVDDSHDEHTWNWVNGHFLSMDKGTTRKLIGAHLFRIEFNTPRGSQIAEFSPAGLNLQSVHVACGLTPKRP